MRFVSGERELVSGQLVSGERWKQLVSGEREREVEVSPERSVVAGREPRSEGGRSLPSEARAVPVCARAVCASG